NGLKVSQLYEYGSSVKLQVHKNWELSVGRVIIATNGFSRRLLPELPLKPARNQVWLTEPIPNLTWEGCYHYDRGYVYFRNIGSRVLIGGARNLAAEAEATDQFGHTDLIGDALKRLLDEVVLPKHPWQLSQKWSGIMGVGAEKKPIIRHHSDRVVLAVRLGGMGVAIGSWVGQEAARLLL
ncbi:MAG: FAD-dependent oxidoreductase, partial [Bacteroidota bacterium]